MRRKILSDTDMINIVRDVYQLKLIRENNRTIQDLQNLLISKKINVGRFGADGSAGNDTLKAINQALAGVTPTQTNTQTTTTNVTGSPTDIEGGVNVSTINIPSKVATGITTAPTTSGYNVTTKDVSGQAGNTNQNTNQNVTQNTNQNVTQNTNQNVGQEKEIDYRQIDFGS